VRPLADQCWVFIRGEEAPGVFVYALAPSERCLPLTVQVAGRRAIGDLIELDDWLVWCATLPLDDGMAEESLLDLFRSLAEEILGTGAFAVWVGNEYSSWNPGILDPGRAYGNVLAAAVEGSGLLVQRSGDGFDNLHDDALAIVWSRILELGVPPDLGAE